MLVGGGWWNTLYDCLYTTWMACCVLLMSPGINMPLVSWLADLQCRLGEGKIEQGRGRRGREAGLVGRSPAGRISPPHPTHPSALMVVCHSVAGRVVMATVDVY